MTRLPYAATTLIGQVRIARPRAGDSIVGHADGLGVHRTIRFTKSAAQWLEPLLVEIKDHRIASLERDDDGGLLVTFISGPGADRRAPFALSEAETVLSANRESESSAFVEEFDDDPDRTTDLDGEPVSTGNSEHDEGPTH